MQTKINAVIMGGTYNPVHIGHLHLAEEVLNSFSPERIILVPSNISAHKQDKKIVNSHHRLEMLKIACRKTMFEIDACEIERGGISYSIDTIRYIVSKYNLKSKPGLVIGDDLVSGFDNWKNAASVADEAQLILACRNAGKLSFEYKHQRVNNLKLEISSSDIRNRIYEGKPCRYLLPAGVYEYIIEHKLYGDL